MPVLEFNQVCKSFGTTTALDDLSFSVSAGEFLVIVGPSGCGKSTVLRLIAGLEAPDQGRILIDGVDAANRPPKSRGCAMVFQSYALYPHWTVFENLAFPLRIRRRPQSEIAARVRAIALSLQLSDQLDRRPKALSGGQRQRVALGRAIAADPRIFLFDEPLSNLDAPLRAEMRREIVDRHRELGKTSLYVTHDQTEALTMADRILVLDRGIIMGVGTPRNLYGDPPNRFVAAFLGRPPINLLRGKIEEQSNAYVFQPWGLALSSERAARLRSGRGEIELGIRPEDIGLVDPDQYPTWRVVAREFLGDKVQYSLSSQAGTLTALSGSDVSASLGSHVGLDFNLSRAMVFDPESGQRLA